MAEKATRRGLCCKAYICMQISTLGRRTGLLSNGTMISNSKFSFKVYPPLVG